MKKSIVNITVSEYEELIKKLTESLNTEIVSIMEELYSKKIGTVEYNDSLNRLNIANKELSNIKKLTIMNFIAEIEEMEKVKTDYSFLAGLNENEIKAFLSTLEEYQKLGFFKMSKTIEVPGNITIEKDSTIKNISINSLEDIEEIKDTIMLLNNRKNYIEIVLSQLKQNRRSIITSDYILFNKSCELGRVEKNSVLENLKIYPYTDHYIKKILEKKARLKELKDNPFKQKEFIKERENVLKLQKYLFDTITEYILFKLGTITDENNNEIKVNVDDVFVKYAVIIEYFEAKKKKLAKLLSQIMGYQSDYLALEDKFIKALNEICSIKDRSDIDKISDLNRDKINDIIATINIYDRTYDTLSKRNKNGKRLEKVNDD